MNQNMYLAQDGIILPDDPMEKMLLNLTGMTSDERKRCKARAVKFPQRLMYILECGDYKDIIAWDPSGRSFVIADPKIFEKRVLPQIFKEVKFSSFHRKLKRWSFVKKGRRIHSYFHPNFRRGDWDRCSVMSSGDKRYREAVFNKKCLDDLCQGQDSNKTLSQCAKIPSLPSLASSPTTTDGSSVHTVSSNLGRYSNVAGEVPQDSHSDEFTIPAFGVAYSDYILSDEALSDFGLELLIEEQGQPPFGTSPSPNSTFSSTNRNQSLQPLNITGTTEKEILENAYKTVFLSPLLDGSNE